MRKTLLILLAAGLLPVSSCIRMTDAERTTEKVPAALEEETYSPFVEGLAHVYFSESTADALEEELSSGAAVPTRSSDLTDALREIGIMSIERLFPDAGKFEARTRAEGLHRWYKVVYDPEIPATRASDILSGLRGVTYWEPVVKVKSHADMPFNDPMLKNQWHYFNDGSAQSWKAGIDINVFPVWQNYTKGSPDVIVAVVDGGIDANHEDLAGQVLTRSSYNFAKGNGGITATSHGTHVGGTIAAINNNGIGVCGIAGGDAAAGNPGTRLISCQVFDTATDGTSLSGGFENAIKWAADHGAVIANNSWGYDFTDDKGNFNLEDAKKYQELFDQPNTGEYGNALKSAIDYFNKYAGIDEKGNQTGPMAGGLVFFSAGNDNRVYGAPANYPGVLAVGAVSPSGGRAYYSSHGDWVDIAAPGGDSHSSMILSTVPGNGYDAMQGTSMACPHMSGVAALVVAACGGPGFTRDMLIERLLGGVNKNVSLRGQQIGSLVDALGAITLGTDETPSQVPEVKTEVFSNTITYSWNVTGSENNIPAHGYFLFYGTDREAVVKATPKEPGTGVTSVNVLTGSAGIGQTLQKSVSKLSFETTYYAKVTGYDYNLHYSESSPVVSATTASNRAPVITADAGSGHFTLKPFEILNLTFGISDPDGHAVRTEYEKGSEADEWTIVPNAKYSLRIVAPNADPGTYTGKITATDEFGAATTLAVRYTVLENHTPERIATLDNILSETLGQEIRLDMTRFFSDPDGEKLHYEIENEDPKVAHLVADDETIYITPIKYGLTSVTVRALDAKKASAEGQFKILVRDPAIDIQIYPNPVVQNLFIATGAEFAETEILIVSATGQKVFEGTERCNAFEPAVVDMSACAPGQYVAIVRLDGKEFKQTVIKK